MNLENPVCKSFQLKLIRAHSMLLLLKRKYENEKDKVIFLQKGISVLFKTKNVKNSVVFSPGQQDGDTVQNWDRGKKGFSQKMCP